MAKGFEADNKGNLTTALVNVYANNGSSAEWAFVYKQFMDAGPQGRFTMLRSFGAMVGRVDKPEYAQQGIAAIKDMGIKYKQFGVGSFVTGLLTDIKGQRAKLNDDTSAKAADAAITAVNDAK